MLIIKAKRKQLDDIASLSVIPVATFEFHSQQTKLVHHINYVIFITYILYNGLA